MPNWGNLKQNGIKEVFQKNCLSNITIDIHIDDVSLFYQIFTTKEKNILCKIGENSKLNV